ncbi:AmmeMemoRadiSam system radical SAM enzyme [bacterium]|nr:AmmeMemoRadiSam system radical SAM enzyme [bacterium]MBU1937945.1 AmmeMemoRadiSam system radical SAM enzyme [bacterium]
MKAIKKQIKAAHAVKDGDKILCELCPRFCKLAEGQQGFCRGREVSNGELYVMNYGQAVSIGVDPIEKKPLFHFHPGKPILSLGPNSCNLSCKFCQNADISQGRVSTHYVSPDELAKLAQQYNSIGVAFTYSEPLMWYEYIRDSAPLVREKGGVIVLVTNGYLCEAPLRELLPYIDAMNVDLKSSQEDFYRRLCGGHLEDVVRTIRIGVEMGCHVEVTHLVVTGENDKEENIRAVRDLIAAISPRIPLHLSRYFPHYKYNEPATSGEFLLKARRICQEKLPFVYLGNIALEGGEDTRCPNCDELIISRRGYATEIRALVNGRCGKCGADLGIIQ